ncbi:unnamed protein product [Prorocentrum cordatum]|uniref:Uncharacterized protein n=1 Tax=Prorocentrum cordatum TaxID=2364126 RepID=A0ABN9UHW3_9DINO|nr:unnamed protein product [Polarella glacialis]
MIAAEAGRNAKYLKGRPRVVQKFTRDRIAGNDDVVKVVIMVDGDDAGEKVLRMSAFGQLAFGGKHVAKHMCNVLQAIGLSSGENEYYAIGASRCAGRGIKGMLEDWNVACKLKVKAEGVPIEGWVEWIRGQLAPEDDPGSAPAIPVQQEVGAAAGDRAAGGPMPALGLMALTTAASTPTPSGQGARFQTIVHASGAVTARPSLVAAATAPAGGGVPPARPANDPLGPTRPVPAVSSGARLAPWSGGGACAGGTVPAGAAQGASPPVVFRPGQAGACAGGAAGHSQPAGGYATYVRPQGAPAPHAPAAPGGGPGGQAGAARA